METQTSEQGQRIQGIRYGATRIPLTVTHHGQDFVFMHPYHGPDTYENIELEIGQSRLIRPNMAETASIVHAAYIPLINSNEPDNHYAKEIRDDIMKNRLLWAFTRSRYEHGKGAFIYPEAEHGRFENLPVDELEQMLGKRQEDGVVYSDDGLLRFVPFGYQIGEMSPSQLAKNAYIIALADAEGSEKLAEVAEEHKYNPRLGSFESVDGSLTRVSALGSVNQGLIVIGYYRGDGRYGCSFGVSGKAGEASAPEK